MVDYVILHIGHIGTPEDGNEVHEGHLEKEETETTSDVDTD